MVGNHSLGVQLVALEHWIRTPAGESIFNFSLSSLCPEFHCLNLPIDIAMGRRPLIIYELLHRFPPGLLAILGNDRE